MSERTDLTSVIKGVSYHSPFGCLVAPLIINVVPFWVQIETASVLNVLNRTLETLKYPRTSELYHGESIPFSET